jgi:hypothetical protein
MIEHREPGKTRSRAELMRCISCAAVNKEETSRTGSEPKKS